MPLSLCNDQAGTGFEWPWSFYVSLKSHASEWFWHSSEARIMYEMQKRSLPSNGDQSPFHFFDGATMLGFRYPHKSREVVFCRRNPIPEACESIGHGFDLYQPNVPLSSLEVKKSGVGEHAGYGLFSKVDIPTPSYLGLEASVHNVIFAADTHELVTSFEVADGNAVPLNAGIADILAYLWGYGFTQRPFVSSVWDLVDLVTFTSFRLTRFLTILVCGCAHRERTRRLSMRTH